MVQAGEGGQIRKRAEESALGVGRAKDAGRGSRLNDGASAHGAGLQGDVDRAACEAPAPEHLRRFAHSDELCVGGEILGVLAGVSAAGDHLAVEDDDSADGDLAFRRRESSQRDGLLHEDAVGLGLTLGGFAGEGVTIRGVEGKKRRQRAPDHGFATRVYPEPVACQGGWGGLWACCGPALAGGRC